MTKSETQKLINKIKGYYNSQFFIDNDVLEAWSETLKNYELDDAVDHLQIYLREYPDVAPKPHTFIRGLKTREEKERIRNSKFVIRCNLCQREMPLQEYEEHYEKCLDIQYLVSVAKEKGETCKREDIENQPQRVINGLLQKYVPNYEKSRT